MTIDYEAEYNNRARVPEHVEIFEQWHRNAAAYRKAMPRAVIGLAYGPSPRQTIDLFPVENDDTTTPLTMFIHGGWWRSLAPSEFSHLAAGANTQGVTVAMAGYDLCPQVGIPAIIEQMRAACLFLWRSRRQRIMVCGHSAGGHLAACMVATDWKTLEPDAPADLVPAAYAISGLFDLAPLLKISTNADLRLDEKTAHACSPLYWDVPRGRSLDAVVGALESSEFLRQSKTIAEAWRQGPTQTRYEAVAGTNHYTVLDALTDSGSPMTKRIVELSRDTCARML